MAAIKLGQRPASFTRIVKFPMVDGTGGALDITFKYRTRTEFGSFIDGLVSKAQAAQSADDQTAVQNTANPADALNMERIMSKSSAANADYLMQVVDSWGLDEPFNLDNARVFADQYPGACLAIMETYRAAVAEGRLGN
jgi:hypothetical protein